ncbi:hypothetical protein V8F33_001245 [Rhypophila sp. PSN 637]
MPPPLNPAILVAYATSTGTTREIAERIASTLEKTTSWRVDCKSVSDLPPLHKQFHVPKSPSAEPAAPEPTTPAAEGEDHTIHANPLWPVITNPEPEIEYKAVVIGSSIHAGQWIHSGRNFVAQNKDFFGGRCCAPPAHCNKGGGWIKSLAHHHEESPPTQENKQQQQSPSLPKVFAFSVGMPGPSQEALTSEQASVEAYLRKALGKRPIYHPLVVGEKEKEEEEVLERHVLFRGMWSPRQIEILAPRIVTKVLRWCIPKDSTFMKEEDERDWEGIERWALGVGKEVLGAEAEAKKTEV